MAGDNCTDELHARLRTALVRAFSRIADVSWCRSRWADRDALYVGSREVAHFQEPCVLDVRLTTTGIRAVASDPRVVTRSSRRSEWATVRVRTGKDIEFARTLLRTAIEHNRSGSLPTRRGQG